jgi:hypothetical protein
MSRTTEQRALSLLEGMASDALVAAAKRAVADGTHTWQQDPVFEGIGLIRVGTNTADVIVYPAGLTFDVADFEVSDEFEEEALSA